VRAIETVEIAGVAFHALSEAECVSHVFSELRRGQGGWIVTANLDHLRRCQGGSDYASLIRKADLVVADGMPIVWASILQGTPLPERVAGSDLVSSLARQAAVDGRSLFLMGGDPGTAEDAGRILMAVNAGLRLAGCFSPPHGFEKRAADQKEIERHLRESKPDIVYVALGSPKQELLIERYRSLLPSAWWIGVGISFSYLAGRLKRPPVWLRRVGGEWVLRLLQEPGRMSQRYLVQGIPFALALLGRAALSRVVGPRSGSAG
jgi:N-acetylglucosaminyldiphosphoundecaprenol N-acetyl-beta-D-mannosaminyltransferase